jgi:hypothetical protein
VDNKSIFCAYIKAGVMADVALQAVGLFALLGGLYFGYRRWIKPHSAHLDWQGRG